ncbi:MAG TPA: DsbA family protein [Parvularculaceae bacterium]|nr:DsbA family protein [Parvularculaceae bacterium]
MLRKIARAGIIVLSLLIAACGGASSKGAADKADQNEQLSVGERANDPNVIAPTDMVMGEKDAPVTVFEYASVTCPHCAAFHHDMLPTIKKDYIDTGKIKLVFREFPTPPQALSVAGSMIARCAADKGGPDAYFAVVGALFTTQRVWVVGDNPKFELQKIAAQAGMDEAAFNACIQRQDLVDLINKNVSEGHDRFGINGTPTFVVNGEALEVRTIDELTTKLDKAYAAATGQSGAAAPSDAGGSAPSQ